MSKRNQTVTAWECDAPECYQSQWVERGESPIGYVIKGGYYEVGGGGGQIPETFACSEDHIGPAIVEKIYNPGGREQ